MPELPFATQDLPSSADVARMRDAQEAARVARAVDPQRLRLAAEQGQLTQAGLERAVKAVKYAQRFSDADFELAIRRAELIRQAAQARTDHPLPGRRLARAFRQEAPGFPRSPEAPAPRPQSPAAQPSRPRSPAPKRAFVPATRILSHQIGEAIARNRARAARETAIAFLRMAGLEAELEHLGAIEERLTVGSRPAQHHAALSTRLLLKGVADRCFVPSDQPLSDRFGARHAVLSKNVGNRIAAFVDQRAGLSDEEHRLFVATLDTVIRWAGRGPHRIYADEAHRFFIRLLDVLVVVSAAYFQPIQPG